MIRPPRIIVYLLALGPLSIASNGAARSATNDGDDLFSGLRSADVRLATTLYRLAVANDELCIKHAPVTGLVLHSANDYEGTNRSAAIRYFDFTSSLGVEGVVAGSPAALVGIEQNDSVISIASWAISPATKLVAALDQIESRPTGRAIDFTIERDGVSRTVVLHPVNGCLARAAVDISDNLNAETDGTTIQVDSALMNLVANDDEFAAVVAHELAHIVLDHPDRLTAAHVNRGMFKGFGRSARLFKRTETEADRLSVTLMANAGYDPQAAVRYWRTFGPQLNDHGGFGSTHLAWQVRADLIAAEVRRVVHQPQRPIIPDWIATRSKPLK